jgi:L-threonylcarbamoyladenylate synthase
MERISLTEANLGSAAMRAAEVLRAGGVVLYPTDTIYGLAVDAFADTPVEKIYACKGRNENKPLHAVVGSVNDLHTYGELTPAGQKLARAFLPGPLTLVLKYRGDANTGIGRMAETIGLRVPDHPFCLALAREYGKPYTTTSANRAGVEPECTVDGILAQLGDAAAYIDLVIDAGELPKCLPSTVVDLSSESPIILREGALPSAKIWEALREEL